MALIAPVVDACQALLFITDEYAVEEILATIAMLVDKFHGTVALGYLPLGIAPEADTLYPLYASEELRHLVCNEASIERLGNAVIAAMPVINN